MRSLRRYALAAIPGSRRSRLRRAGLQAIHARPSPAKHVVRKAGPPTRRPEAPKRMTGGRSRGRPSLDQENDSSPGSVSPRVRVVDGEVGPHRVGRSSGCSPKAARHPRSGSDAAPPGFRCSKRLSVFSQAPTFSSDGPMSPGRGRRGGRTDRLRSRRSSTLSLSGSLVSMGRRFPGTEAGCREGELSDVSVSALVRGHKPRGAISAAPSTSRSRRARPPGGCPRPVRGWSGPGSSRGSRSAGFRPRRQAPDPRRG